MSGLVVHDRRSNSDGNIKEPAEKDSLGLKVDQLAQSVDKNPTFQLARFF